MTMPMNTASPLFSTVREMEDTIKDCDDVVSFYLSFGKACREVFPLTEIALLRPNTEGAFIPSARGDDLSLTQEDEFIDFSHNFVVQRFVGTRKMTVVPLDGKIIHLIPVYEQSTIVGLMWLESEYRMPASIEMIVFHMLNTYKNKERRIEELPEVKSKGLIEMLVGKLRRLFERR